MRAFIALHGAYIGFWLAALLVGTVAGYWAIRLAIRHELGFRDGALGDE